MKAIFTACALIIGAMLMTACGGYEDQYLSKLYSKESRTWAINQIIKEKDKIENKERTIKKLLSLDQTPDIPMALGAVGAIGDPIAVPRIGEIVDEALKVLNVRNLKTLEAAAMALGNIGDPSAAPILGKYFTIQTPEGLAAGQREKPESVAKRAAIEALAKMPEAGKQFLPQILQVFASKYEDFGTKYTTAGVIGEFGDPSAVAPLVTALFYEEQGYSLFPEARKSIIRLGKYAENAIMKAYKNEDVSVNEILDKYREKALKQFCPEYLDPEKKKKGECSKHDEYTATIAGIDATTKIKTAILLADIRSQKAVDMLIAELDAQLSKEQKQAFLAEHLAVSLAKFGDFKATDTLLRMVSKKFALKAAKEKKGEKKDKDAKIAEKMALRGQEVSIRMKGAEALAILGDPKAIPYLLEAIKAPEDKEQNVEGQWIVFYEPKVWAADAYSRMISDPKAAEEFIAFANKFVAEARAYVKKVEDKERENLEKQMKGNKEFAAMKPEEKDKKIKSQAVLDPNYESAGRAATMVERFGKRVEIVKECAADPACYAKKLDDKEPAHVEKAVYMLGFSKKLGAYKEKVQPIFSHVEPYVRVALTQALLKEEDKGFLPILAEAIKTEGDKVEYAESSKEYRAIYSYLQSL